MQALGSTCHYDSTPKRHVTHCKCPKTHALAAQEAAVPPENCSFTGHLHATDYTGLLFSINGPFRLSKKVVTVARGSAVFPGLYRRDDASDQQQHIALIEYQCGPLNGTLVGGLGKSFTLFVGGLLDLQHGLAYVKTASTLDTRHPNGRCSKFVHLCL